MKLMKHITIALVLCAIPAVAVGQTVSCDDCTHEVSVYMGEGGLIAETDADEVTYVATCNGVTRSGELMANDDGMVSMLLAGDLACHGDDDASFELGPIMDGGWYWITMEDNSAVGGLVSMDILENDTVDLADAGEGVKMTMGSGAVLLSETATGRVGILPNILPEPPAPDAVICGPRQNPSWPYAYDRQMTSSCMLGGGKTKVRLVGPGAHGSTAMITNGMVYRPNAGTITVTADLWVDESGSYTTTASDGGTFGDDLQKGWIGKTATAQGRGSQTNWLDATFIGSVNATVGAPVVISTGTPVAGIDITETGTGSTPTGQATFTIAPDSAYCSRTANHTAVLNVVATPGTNAIHPAVATGKDAGLGSSASLETFAAIEQLRVVCPPSSSSANQGQELVPENPFPVE